MDKNEQLEKHLVILEKLSNGINPIDDTPFPIDSPINNVEIARALFFALSQLKSSSKTPARKKYFCIDENKLANYEFLPDGAYLSQIIEKLNDLIDEDKMKKLSRKKMVNWLVDIGILSTVQLGDRKTKRHLPTEQGLTMGLEVVKLTDKFGNDFEAVKYPLSMQKFILDNLDSLYNWLATKKSKK